MSGKFFKLELNLIFVQTIHLIEMKIRKGENICQKKEIWVREFQSLGQVMKCYLQ